MGLTRDVVFFYEGEGGGGRGVEFHGERRRGGVMMGVLWWGEESGGRVFPRVAVSMLRGTHGSATSMNGIFIHGNRYLFMVVFHPSHGQITTNCMYLPMDIGDIHGSSTKSMEKQLEAKDGLASAVSFPDYLRVVIIPIKPMTIGTSVRQLDHGYSEPHHVIPIRKLLTCSLMIRGNKVRL